MRNKLDLDLGKTTADIIDLIKTKCIEMDRNGAVLGFSGGLDSALTAALLCKALKKENIYLLYMPERDSKKIHQKHAKLLAEEIGCKYIEESITGGLRSLGVYGVLPLGFVPFQWMRSALVKFGKKYLMDDREKGELISRMNYEPESWVARGNAYAMAKHRLRVVVIYKFAEIHNLMVVGAVNRTEWLTGTFSKWGIDHCADIMPILHLYRTQVERIADYTGVPELIREKPADPDILPGLDMKNELLGDFKLVDNVLFDMQDGMSRKIMIERYPQNLVDKLWELNKLSRHMRESPYSLE